MAGSSQFEIWNRVKEWLAGSDTVLDGTLKEVRETHISVLFFFDQRVLKLKKPVKYDFLDYETPEARKIACEAEVRLNHDLAPDVYLGVRGIVTDETGYLSWEGSGRPVEWVVVMRRLPEDRMLDRLIMEGRVTGAERESLVERLGSYYASISGVAERWEAAFLRMAEHVRGNFMELAKPDYHFLDQELVTRLRNRQQQFLAANRTEFDQRVKGRRIIMGHGDLRPEHVCMEPKPVVFDCIDFNDEFRELDVADELAFFAVECEFLGEKSLGEAVFRRYCMQSGDAVSLDLFEFYKSYRACVRAKVSVLRARQVSGDPKSQWIEHAVRYLELADRDLGTLASPRLFLVRGRSGTGKSTVAIALGDAIAAPVLRTDALRQQEKCVESICYGSGTYSAEARHAVYDSLFERAGELLAGGTSVILDACFLKQGLQGQASDVAYQFGVPVHVVTCTSSLDTCAQRILERAESPGNLSDIRPDLLLSQAEEDEGPIKGTWNTIIDTEAGFSEGETRKTSWIRQILEDRS